MSTQMERVAMLKTHLSRHSHHYIAYKEAVVTVLALYAKVLEKEI